MKKMTKTLMICLAFAMTACSSDDSEPIPVKVPSAKIEVENLTAKTIPDAVSPTNPGEMTSAVTVESEGIITDASKISIKLDLQHTFAGDIVIQIFAPSGQSCTLMKRVGSTNAGSSRDLLSGNPLTFNTLATVTINEEAIGSAAVNIPAGMYLPGNGFNVTPDVVVMSDLSAFLTGKSIKGQWIVKVNDYNPVDSGKLNNWKLVFDTGALN